MKPYTITKALKEVHKLLGEKYKIQIVDLEQCITRKYDEHYFLEVSGLNRNRKVMSCTIYLWYDRMLTTVKSKVQSVDELQKQLERIEANPRNVFLKSLIDGEKESCGKCRYLGVSTVCCCTCPLGGCELECTPFHCPVKDFLELENKLNAH